MTEAPERIWAGIEEEQGEAFGYWYGHPHASDTTEYVRADLATQSRNDALEEAAKAVECVGDGEPDPILQRDGVLIRAAAAIRALKE